MERSLKETNFSHSKFISQASSFNIYSTSQRSQFTKRYKDAKRLGLPIQNNPLYGESTSPKKSKIKTFYTMLASGGFISEGNEDNLGRKKEVVREWHSKKRALDEDSEDNSDNDHF